MWYITFYITSSFFFPHMHFYKIFFYKSMSFFVVHKCLCYVIFFSPHTCIFSWIFFYTSMNFYVVHKCLHYVIFFLYAPYVFSLHSHTYYEKNFFHKKDLISTCINLNMSMSSMGKCGQSEQAPWRWQHRKHRWYATVKCIIVFLTIIFMKIIEKYAAIPISWGCILACFLW